MAADTGIPQRTLNRLIKITNREKIFEAKPVHLINEKTGKHSEFRIISWRLFY